MSTCPICFESLLDVSTASPDVCDHVFCMKCLTKWSKHESFCPIDRKRFRSIVDLDTETSVEIKTHKRRKVKTLYDVTVYCEKCKLTKKEDTLLLCDCCDLGYHCECLTPPLESVPPGRWFCPICVSVEAKMKFRKGDAKGGKEVLKNNGILKEPPKGKQPKPRRRRGSSRQNSISTSSASNVSQKKSTIGQKEGRIQDLRKKDGIKNSNINAKDLIPSCRQPKEKKICVSEQDYQLIASPGKSFYLTPGLSLSLQNSSKSRCISSEDNAASVNQKVQQFSALKNLDPSTSKQMFSNGNSGLKNLNLSTYIPLEDNAVFVQEKVIQFSAHEKLHPLPSEIKFSNENSGLQKTHPNLLMDMQNNFDEKRETYEECETFHPSMDETCNDNPNLEIVISEVRSEAPDVQIGMNNVISSGMDGTEVCISNQRLYQLNLDFSDTETNSASSVPDSLACMVGSDESCKSTATELRMNCELNFSAMEIHSTSSLPNSLPCIVDSDESCKSTATLRMNYINFKANSLQNSTMTTKGKQSTHLPDQTELRTDNIDQKLYQDCGTKDSKTYPCPGLINLEFEEYNSQYDSVFVNHQSGVDELQDPDLVNPMQDFELRNSQYAQKAEMNLQKELQKIEQEKWKSWNPSKGLKLANKNCRNLLDIPNKQTAAVEENKNSNSNLVFNFTEYTKKVRNGTWDPKGTVILERYRGFASKNHHLETQKNQLKSSCSLNVFQVPDSQDSFLKNNKCQFFSLNPFKSESDSDTSECNNHQRNFLKGTLHLDLEEMSMRKDGSLYLNWSKCDS